jgi:hypothetical protein
MLFVRGFRLGSREVSMVQRVLLLPVLVLSYQGPEAATPVSAVQKACLFAFYFGLFL